MEPTVSVVIATFNRAQLLAKCLDALETQRMARERYEVLVIDNGSTDGTVEFLDNRCDKSPVTIRWFRHPRGGPASARNLGVDQARGDLIAFTDDDCIPASDWLTALAAELPDSPTCAGIGGPIWGMRDTAISRYIDHAKLMAHWVDADQVEYLITANALYRTSCLTEVGGFETGFVLAGGEDVDLSYRLRDCGYSLHVTDQGAVQHHHHDTLRLFTKMNWRHGFGAAQLVQRGLLPPRATGPLALVKSLVRAVRSKSPRGARSLSEAALWRALTLVQAAAKQSGYGAGVRKMK